MNKDIEQLAENKYPFPAGWTENDNAALNLFSVYRAKREAFIAGYNSTLRWVKASERLPEHLDDLQIHYRHSVNKMKLRGNFYEHENGDIRFRNFPPCADDYDILQGSFKYIEWLEESVDKEGRDLDASDKRFKYFPNHGDEEGRNCFTICYAGKDEYGDDDFDTDCIIVSACDTEEDAIECCKRLNNILLASDNTLKY